MDIESLCMGCMRERPRINNDRQKQYVPMCPFCGFDRIKYTRDIEAEEQSVIETNKKTMYSGTTAALELPQRPLPPGTVIGGDYVIGKKLGAGGFGVSYIGFDKNFERRVAVKEFYPRGCADRDITGTNLVPRAGKRGVRFEEEREKFAHEGKVLAKFDEPGVVRVLSFVRAFNTAYIIMEFLEGKSLASYLRERGNYLPPAEALELVRPVIKSLSKLHEKGVIHRDISPDNIMLTQNGPKLIDFGAALGQGEYKEGAVIGKKGYAPIEQMKGTSIGPYSDVYAMCAMMYQMITSQKPPRSLERQQCDEIYSISAYQVYMPPVQEAAIMQGLAMDYRQRIKNAGDLYYLLYVYGADADSSVEGLQKMVRESATDVVLKKMKNENKRSRNKTRMLIATVTILILGCMIIAVRQISKIISDGNKSKPVVITEDSADAENTDSGSQDDTQTTVVDLAAYRDMLYESVNSDRKDNPASINEDYQLAADYTVGVCANADCSTTDEWNETMTDAAIDGLDRYSISYQGATAVGWVLRTYGNDMTIDSVKQDIYDYIAEINSGVDNPIDLSNCGEFGVSVGVHADGTYFWMVIYR
jgi:serine/threonine protein kinase